MLKGIRSGLPTSRGDLRLQCLATGLQRKENKCKRHTCSQCGAVPQGPSSQILSMVPARFPSQHASLRAFIPALSQLAAYVPVWWDCKGVLGHPQGLRLLFRCCAVGAPVPGLRPVRVLPLCSWPSAPAGQQQRPCSGFGKGVLTERRGRAVPPSDSTASSGPRHQPGHQRRAGGWHGRPTAPPASGAGFPQRLHQQESAPFLLCSLFQTMEARSPLQPLGMPPGPKARTNQDSAQRQPLFHAHHNNKNP